MTMLNDAVQHLKYHPPIPPNSLDADDELPKMMVVTVAVDPSPNKFLDMTVWPIHDVLPDDIFVDKMVWSLRKLKVFAVVVVVIMAWEGHDM